MKAFLVKSNTLKFSDFSKKNSCFWKNAMQKSTNLENRKTFSDQLIEIGLSGKIFPPWEKCISTLKELLQELIFAGTDFCVFGCDVYCTGKISPPKYNRDLFNDVATVLNYWQNHTCQLYSHALSLKLMHFHIVSCNF